MDLRLGEALRSGGSLPAVGRLRSPSMQLSAALET